MIREIHKDLWGNSLGTMKQQIEIMASMLAKGRSFPIPRPINQRQQRKRQRRAAAHNGK